MITNNQSKTINASDFGLVSIIMPMYNDEKFVEDAINSVLKQTYPNWELIIVDDCSRDKSAKIVNGFKDKRITLIQSITNKGAAHSRNVALRLAHGDWIAFLDADDIWLPEKLKKQLFFMKNNDFSFSYCGYMEANEALQPMYILKGPKKINRQKMQQCCYLGCLTVMYNANVIGQLQVDEEIKKRNDYALWIEAIKKAQCYYLNETLAIYRRRSGGISSVSPKAKILWAKKLYRTYSTKNNAIAFVMALRCGFFTLLKRFFFRKKIRKN